MVWKPLPDISDDIPIARMDRETDMTVPTERDANAQLIAAAPKLLSLVRGYMNTYPLDDYHDSAEEIVAQISGAFIEDAK